MRVRIIQPDGRGTSIDAAGQMSHKWANAWALVDTGSGGCVIDPELVRGLELAPEGKDLETKTIVGATSARHFRVGVLVDHADVATDSFIFLSAAERPTDHMRGVSLILGATWLQFHRLNYDGPARRFTLTW
ncbi:MAG TPA: aspartyl protease family protein [Candidatus Cybelea sp.]|nr:aspartyl protease family protein [Candidatus Cybelea sp.]